MRQASVRREVGRGWARSPRRSSGSAPGTIHLLVNEGQLELVVVMQNAGLPEAGDAVFPFPPAVLADSAAYGEAAMLSQDWPEDEREQRTSAA